MKITEIDSLLTHLGIEVKRFLAQISRQNAKKTAF